MNILSTKITFNKLSYNGDAGNFRLGSGYYLAVSSGVYAMNDESQKEDILNLNLYVRISFRMR